MKSDYFFPKFPAAILFDLDGTLVDSAPDLVAAVNHLRIEQGLEKMPFDSLRSYASYGAAGLIHAALGVTAADGEIFDRLKYDFLDFYHSNLDVLTCPFDGVTEVLEYLERNSIPWGVVTNKHERFALPLIASLGWAERASVMVCGDTTQHAKPHPAPMLFAAKYLNLPADLIVYIGDDRRDIQAARAGGYMSAIAVAYGYGRLEEIIDWEADVVLQRPIEFLALLESCLAY